MKMHTLVISGLMAMLMFGLAGCSEGSNVSDASGEDSSKPQSAETTPRVSAEDPSDILPEFPYPIRLPLNDTSIGLNSSYVSPGQNITSSGYCDVTSKPEVYYAAYSCRDLADIGGSSLKAEDIFDACLETVLMSAAELEGTDGAFAKDANITSIEKADVNGWPMAKVVGTFEGNKDGSSVSTNFVGYTVINGQAATWFYVADNTAAKSTPLSDLEDLAKRIAESYRNED